MKFALSLVMIMTRILMIIMFFTAVGMFLILKTFVQILDRDN